MNHSLQVYVLRTCVLYLWLFLLGSLFEKGLRKSGWASFVFFYIVWLQLQKVASRFQA